MSGLMQLVGYGAQDYCPSGGLFLNESLQLAHNYSLIVESDIGGFKIKRMMGCGVDYEYAVSENKFNLDEIIKIYENDQLIYICDDPDENLLSYLGIL